jgi:hypothetical protein
LDRLAQELQDWDKGSRYNWRVAIQALGRDTIEACLRDTITAYHQGEVKKNKVRYFMWLVDSVAQEKGIRLWHRHEVKPEDEIREVPRAAELEEMRAHFLLGTAAVMQGMKETIQRDITN